MKRPGCELLDRPAKMASLIHLNIGGIAYDTTKSTLCGSEYFATLLEGPFTVDLDENGRIFADRDGDLFGILLNSMRTGQRPSQADIDLKKHELLAECEFFGIDWLSCVIRGLVVPRHLAPLDRRIREDEIHAKMHGHGSELLDVFATDMGQISPTSLQLPILLRDVAPQPVLCPSLQIFRDRLDNFTGNLLSALEHIGQGLVIAGGAATAALCGTKASDVDIFLVGLAPEEAFRKTEQVFEALKKNAVGCVLVTRSNAALTFFRMQEKRLSALPPIQLVLFIAKNLEQLLLRFDVDASCVAYDLSTKKVLCTKRGRRAMQTGVNVVDNEQFESNLYWERIERYAGRGFSVGLPGYEAERVSKKLLDNEYVLLKSQTEDLLLRTDKIDRGRFAVKVPPHSVTSASKQDCSLITGPPRLVVLDNCTPRPVVFPSIRFDKERCQMEAHSANGTVVCNNTGRCSYELLWGARVVDSDTDSDSDDIAETLEGYTATPSAAVFNMLQKRFEETLDADAHWEGGVLMKAQKAFAKKPRTAASVLDRDFYTRQSQNKPILLVYDFAQENTSFKNLTFVHDAARPPLGVLDDDAFAKSYQLKRRLAFQEGSVLREAAPTDLWTQIYK